MIEVVVWVASAILLVAFICAALRYPDVTSDLPRPGFYGEAGPGQHHDDWPKDDDRATLAFWDDLHRGYPGLRDGQPLYRLPERAVPAVPIGDGNEFLGLRGTIPLAETRIDFRCEPRSGRPVWHTGRHRSEDWLDQLLDEQLPEWYSVLHVDRILAGVGL